jgi:hypothetical protein
MEVSAVRARRRVARILELLDMLPVGVTSEVNREVDAGNVWAVRYGGDAMVWLSAAEEVVRRSGRRDYAVAYVPPRVVVWRHCERECERGDNDALWECAGCSWRRTEGVPE